MLRRVGHSPTTSTHRCNAVAPMRVRLAGGHHHAAVARGPLLSMSLVTVRGSGNDLTGQLFEAQEVSYPCRRPLHTCARCCARAACKATAGPLCQRSGASRPAVLCHGNMAPTADARQGHEHGQRGAAGAVRAAPRPQRRQVGGSVASQAGWGLAACGLQYRRGISMHRPQGRACAAGSGTCLPRHACRWNNSQAAY